jgi:RNase P/RNase MRP subunit POP5
MLKLKSSARIKKRYILFSKGNEGEIKKTILDSIGILGWARASPVFVKGKDKVILSVDRKEIDNVRAAFEISERDIKILKISGTLDGLER